MPLFLARLNILKILTFYITKILQMSLEVSSCILDCNYSTLVRVRIIVKSKSVCTL